MVEILGAHGMRVQLEAGEIRHPRQVGRVARHDLLGAAAGGKAYRHHLDPSRAVFRRALLVEELGVDAIGIAHQDVGPASGAARRGQAAGPLQALHFLGVGLDLGQERVPVVPVSRPAEVEALPRRPTAEAGRPSCPGPDRPGQSVPAGVRHAGASCSLVRNRHTSCSRAAGSSASGERRRHSPPPGSRLRPRATLRRAAPGSGPSAGDQGARPRPRCRPARPAGRGQGLPQRLSRSLLGRDCGQDQADQPVCHSLSLFKLNPNCLDALTGIVGGIEYRCKAGLSSRSGQRDRARRRRPARSTTATATTPPHFADQLEMYDALDQARPGQHHQGRHRAALQARGPHPGDGGEHASPGRA